MAVMLEDVLITAELGRRPSREPDFEAETRALAALADELAAGPRDALQKVVELALELCRADSAGVGVLEPAGSNVIFRWHAVAGAIAPSLTAATCSEGSPCASLPAAHTVLLLNRAERYFAELRGVEPPIYESLVAPWTKDGETIVTLWAIAHTPERRFDAEDARLLEHLARFASAAWQAASAAENADAAGTPSKRQLEDKVDERTASLAASERRLRLAIELAQLGTWTIDLSSGVAELDDRGASIVGLEPGAPVDAFEAQRERVHPDDLPRLDATLAAGIERGGTIDLDYRVVFEDGSVHHVESRVLAVPESGQLVGINRDVTAEREAERVLHESEQQQAFLLSLSDALRPLSDPAAIQGATARLLREHFDAGWSYYAEFDESQTTITVLSDSVRDPLPSMTGAHPFSDMPELLALWQAGEIVRIDDFQESALLSRRAKDLYRATGIASFLGAPVRKQGVLIAALVLADTEPQPWSDLAVALTAESAERTWATVERARAEAELRTSEEEHRHLFEAMGQGFAYAEIVRDVDGRAIDYRIVTINPAFERLVGIPVAEARGRTAREILPQIEDWWIETFDTVVREGAPRHFEHEIGSLGRWYEVYAYPRGGDGFTVLYEDISQRKRIELALRESDERRAFLLALSDALRPLDDPVAIQAEACRLLGERLGVARAFYVEVNEAEARARVERDHVRGETPSLAGDQPLAAYRWTLPLLRKGETVVVADAEDSKLVPGDGRDALAAVHIRAHVSVPLLKREVLVGALCVAESEPREWLDAEVELAQETGERIWAAVQQARAEAAEKATRERRDELEREFVANAAHELRTPLTAIISAVDALNQGAMEVPEHRARFFEHLTRETTRLARLSESLLLLARIDTEPHIPRSPVRLRGLLEAVADQVRARASVPVSVLGDANLSATTNEGLLERAVFNLADNAVKHTEHGEIELSAHRADGRLVVEVRDRGVGVSADVSRRAFDRFYRGGPRAQGGFGLGLAIAKQVALALEAELELVPRDGGGAVARLTLPGRGTSARKSSSVSAP